MPTWCHDDPRCQWRTILGDAQPRPPRTEVPWNRLAGAIPRWPGQSLTSRQSCLDDILLDGRDAWARPRYCPSRLERGGGGDLRQRQGGESTIRALTPGPGVAMMPVSGLVCPEAARPMPSTGSQYRFPGPISVPPRSESPDRISADQAGRATWCGHMFERGCSCRSELFADAGSPRVQPGQRASACPSRRRS